MIRHAPFALVLVALGAQAQATTRYDEMLLETQVCARPAAPALELLSARNLAGDCARDAPEFSA